MNRIKEAIQILKSGGVVVYPTDTAYGLAVDATNPAAVKKLYQLKGRDFHNPIHVIPPTKDWIEKLVKLSPVAKKIIDRLMPGPLTLVLPLKAKGKPWQMLSAGTNTLGIRRPKHKLALDLAMLLRKPITTTSANVSGQPNCYSVAEVKRQFEPKLPHPRLRLRREAAGRLLSWKERGVLSGRKPKPDFYLDGGKLRKTRPSTVVLIEDPTPGPSPIKGRGVLSRRESFHAKILRPGPISESQIKRVISK